MRIKLSDIFIGDRLREDYGKKEMADLQKDMEENGQITPITVRPPSDDDRKDDDYDGQPWSLVAGGRRLLAATMLGWEDIEGYAREEMSTLTAQVLELHENLFRKAMTPIEEANARRQLVELRRIEKPDITLKEVAAELKIAAGQLTRDVQVSKILEQRPGLARAGTKQAIINAGKLLDENEQRAKRIMGQQTSGPAQVSAVEPLAERVVTAEAQAFAAALPANSVDLFLCDGPYAYNYWKLGGKSTEAQGGHLSSYDDDPERNAAMYRLLFPEVVRAARETGWLVFFCGYETYELFEELASTCCATHASYQSQQFPKSCELAVAGSVVGACRFLRPEPHPWIWYRPNSRNQPRFPQLHAKSFAELIFVCNMGKARIVRAPFPSVLVHDAEYGSERVHANQKPIPLYRQLIEGLTFTGDTVVDLFFGSGNSLAAAASLARVPRGCDRNAEMLAFARGAIERHQQPVTKDAIEASFRRYQQGLNLDIVEDDPSETLEPLTTNHRPSAARTEGQVYEYETFRVGDRYLGYIKYDGHTMAQLADTDQGRLELMLGEACEYLDGLNGLELLDACCCTPDECQEAVNKWKEERGRDSEG